MGNTLASSTTLAPGASSEPQSTSPSSPKSTFQEIPDLPALPFQYDPDKLHVLFLDYQDEDFGQSFMYFGLIHDVDAALLKHITSNFPLSRVQYDDNPKHSV